MAEDVSRMMVNGGVKTGDDILDDPNAFNMTRHTEDQFSDSPYVRHGRNKHEG